MDHVKLGVSSLDVSRLCLGCMPFGARISGLEIDRLVDCFLEAGGNFFDTAHCYSFWETCREGASERALGDCIRRRGSRDQVVIATKGGHPSASGYRTVDQYLSPGRIAADIDDSLARLQTDVIDLYWLHRDDPRVPVGEILDILNAEVARGRIRYFGGSNWTSQRLDHANDYAEKHGISGFVASQPRWSLLHYEPMSEADRLKPGVLLYVNSEDCSRHTLSQLPVIPYGPTGNGFFANGGNAPEKFRSPENQARAQRAAALAAELNATANQVALAWLLHQPFTVIPIVGTSRVDHLKDAVEACDVRLTPRQMKWLETGVDEENEQG